MKELTYRLLLIASLLLTLNMHIFPNPTIHAQDNDPIPTLDPDDPQPQQDITTLNSMIQDFLQRLSQISIHDVRIVHLSAPGANAPESHVDASKMQSQLGVMPVNSWDEVIALDGQLVIDALIIDASAIDMVDPLWTREAYQNREVAVVLVNAYYTVMDRFIGGNCAGDNLTPPFSGNYFIVSHLSISGSPDVRAQLINNLLVQCMENPVHGIGEQYSLSVDGLQYMLDTDEGYSVLSDFLISSVANKQ